MQKDGVLCLLYLFENFLNFSLVFVDVETIHFTSTLFLGANVDELK